MADQTSSPGAPGAGQGERRIWDGDAGEYVPFVPAGDWPAAVPVSAPPPAPGREEMVSDEMVERALRAQTRHAEAIWRYGAEGPTMQAALAAVLPDVEERVRQECAEELRAAICDKYADPGERIREARELADRWATPPGQDTERRETE